MKKTIKIGDKELEFESTALTSIAYKRIFGSDVLAALGSERSLSSDIRLTDSIKQLAFLMNKQAEGLDVPKIMGLQEMDFFVWLNQFEHGDLDKEEVITQIIAVWTANLETASESKNAEGAQLDR